MNFTEEEMERGDYLYDARRDAKVERAIKTMTKYKTGTQFRHMIHRQVMVVARIRHDGWKSYCFPCPGQNHDDEEFLWETEGSQLSEKVARTMFGFLEDLPYAR